MIKLSDFNSVLLFAFWLQLQDLGFARQQAVEAFLACAKNEQMAANILFDSM